MTWVFHSYTTINWIHRCNAVQNTRLQWTKHRTKYAYLQNPPRQNHLSFPTNADLPDNLPTRRHPNPSHIRKLLGKWLVSRSLGAPTKLTFVADKCSLARQRPTRRHPTPTPIFWKLLGKWLFSQFRAIFIFFVLSLFFDGRGAGAPGPRLVRLWILCLFVAELWVITFPVGYHWKCVCDHCIYAESRDLWARGQKELHAGTAHLERSARPHPHRGWSCLVPNQLLKSHYFSQAFNIILLIFVFFPVF